MSRKTLFFILSFTVFMPLPGETRLWTNAKNQTAEGELISATDTEAIIHFTGQKNSRSVALDTLSEEDQEFIAAFLDNGNKTDSSPGKKKQSNQSDLDDIPDNFDDKWPKTVKSPEDITIEVAEEDPENKKYVYHSDHYEFICDVPLKTHLVKKFAVMFEGTRELCRVLPISTKKARLTGDDFRHRILLFESKETYFRNGGPPGSAGVFMGGGKRGNVVMVPLTSLGVKN